MVNPKVSIIVPNYNHYKFLKQRLDSVFNQTFQDFEVILLDDCSTDKSLEILNTYKTHKKVSYTIFNSTNSGSPFRQWQKGIDLAKGEYIWIAESDDYCEFTFLEKTLKVFKSDPSLGLCYCQSTDVDENNNFIQDRIGYTKRFTPNIWKHNFSLNGKQFVSNYMPSLNVIPNASAVVFKRTCVSDTFFSEKLLQMRMCGDWWFWIQLCLSTKVGFLAENLNYFRDHIAVTRNHKGVNKKKKRLLEEACVRSFMEKVGVHNKKDEAIFYKLWFKIHSKKDFFLKSFYTVKLAKTSIFGFIIKGIQYKLKHKKIW